jgi:hypothetical protein
LSGATVRPPVELRDGILKATEADTATSLMRLVIEDLH